MAGVNLDPRLANVFDFMVPLPTSAANRINVLGDHVGTDDALQRVVQIMTGGSYPLPVRPQDAHSEAAYDALFDSGFRPPSINPSKGYVIDGEVRPLSDAEIQKYTQLRGDYLKEALASLPDPSDKKAVQAAYNSANAKALAEVGVVSSANTPAARSQSSATASSSASPSGAAQANPAAYPGRRPPIGGRHPGRAATRAGRGSRALGRRGPSTRAGRPIIFKAGATRSRGGSVRGARRRA